MKYFMKQQVFSWRDRFYIRDESGRDIFSVEGELLTLGAKLHVYGAGGQEVAFIHQKLLSFMPRYIIDIAGSEIGTVIQRISFFKGRYDVEGLNWSAEGSFGAHEFWIQDAGQRQVMSVRKAWFTWGDSYEIDIADENDVLPAICVLLAIDMSIEARSRNSASIGQI